MKNSKILMATLLVSSAMLTACGGTTGSMAAGSDTKYMNASRGSSAAHVSAAQEEQYARQQRLTAREIQLENMKRRQGTDAVKEGASAVNSAVGALHSIDSLRNLF